MKISWSVVAGRLLGFGLSAFVFYQFFLAEDHPKQTVVAVNQDLGLAGKVTGYNKARGNKIYLNSSPVPYTFDDFENQELTRNDGLGYYLEQGDSVYKAPNAKVLRLVRHGQGSTWFLVAPAAAAP
jgi:hypothetical protein